MSAMTDACVTIAAITRGVIARSGKSPEAALTEVLQAYRDEAKDADARTGPYQRFATTEEIENAMFMGAIACDIADGTIERPSTGNVRAYVLNLL
jgi:hypothetical protein